jgi:membrane-bound acyltransferase YfiQ involved in biofilm formation
VALCAGLFHGIYLAHAMFLEAFEFGASRPGCEIAPYSVLTKVLISILISACCIVFIWFARLNRVSAYLLLGEKPCQPRVTTPPPGQAILS